MSQQDLKEFAEKVNDDAALRSALEERFGDLTDIPADELVGFAEERGYEFTVEDARGELSDEDLENVTGGTSLLYDKSSPLLYDMSYDLQADSFNFIKIA